MWLNPVQPMGSTSTVNFRRDGVTLRGNDAYNVDVAVKGGEEEIIQLVFSSALPHIMIAGGSWLTHSPIRISKTVLPTVKSGPPDLIKSRTFSLRFRLAV